LARFKSIKAYHLYKSFVSISKNFYFSLYPVETQDTPQPLTLGLLQLGLDIEAIISSAYPSFGFGGRNSVGFLVVNLYFYFFIGLQFRAGQSTMPCLCFNNTDPKWSNNWKESKNDNGLT
jgi:hypothetical protein